MKPKLTLKPHPDGFGFIYGEVVVGDGARRVNIMPPRTAWRGDFALPGYGPHATDWVIYLDDEEIGRVRTREELEDAVLNVIAQS